MNKNSERTPLSDLFANLQPAGQGLSVRVTEDWMQGRAIFGGLSTALCLAAAQQSLEELPPLRSATMLFIGPARSPELELVAMPIRRGKYTAFVEVALRSEDAPVARAVLTFGKARPSKFSAHWLPAPEARPVEECPPFFEAGPAPNFAGHFNSRFAGGQIPASGADAADVCAWLQHKDPAARHTTAGLVALADALPPAAVTLLDEFAPVSSMTWMFDVVGDPTATEDGWWLSRSTGEVVGDGYSTQKMGIWAQDGRPVIIGQQNCAIFA